MKLYLIRHGQSTHNAGTDAAHDPDPPLTALGREQAALAAQALHGAQIGAVALYAGPQRRALETAAALHRTLALSPHIVPDLCEAGGLHGHPGMGRRAILGAWPEASLHEDITEDGWWRLDEDDRDDAAFYSRAHRASAWLRARHETSRDTILVVTHGRFGSALVSALLGLSPIGYNRYPFDNCGVTRIDFDPSGPVGYARSPEPVALRLRFHNDTAHLPPALRT